ncbi:MAG TPA: efflux RND transporter periplasmic adaptor subunit, partial [Opitutaceae bacterium]
KAAVAQNEGVVKADQGAVASAELQLSFCQVVAPISGVVGLRQVDVGNLVHSSDANGIVVITQVQPISVRFSIPEDNVPSVMNALAKGEKLPAQIYDRSMSKHITDGALVATDNQIDTTTGTLRLKAVVPNEKRELFSNQFVNVRLLVNTERGVLLIPTSAIQLNGQDSYVFVVSDDNTVHRTQVKTGNSEGILTVISQGLTLGQKVVTEGLDRLQDGATVEVRSAADEAAINAPAPEPQHKWHRRNGQGGPGGVAPGGQGSSEGHNGPGGQNGQGGHHGQGSQSKQGQSGS